MAVGASTIACSADPISVDARRPSGGDGDGLHIEGLSYRPDQLYWSTTEEHRTASEEAADGGERGTFQARSFVRTFRQSSPYINAFSGRVFVIHIPGSIVHEPVFGNVMEDIALMHIVGIKLVLVLGPETQIERRLHAEGIPSLLTSGHRVTDDQTLRIVTEASGNLQFQIESMLSRGVVNMPSNSRLSIVSSNFYTAKPLGVLDGRDFGLTGTVRKVDVETMSRRLDDGDILIVRNIAASPSGQLFNCQSHHVAGACAAALVAEKLIFLDSSNSIYDKRIGKPIHFLSISAASSFLDSRAADDLPPRFSRLLTTSVKALKNGVTRAHLLDRAVDGVLLMEVFHRDGVGLMLSADQYEGIRPAELDDVLGIEKVVQPLMQQGVLVPRRRATIEQSLKDFIVVERDGMIIACLSLSIMSDERDGSQWAELGCLAVHPSYRGLGKGDSMLGFTEQLAFSRGVRYLFILSTTSFQWFLERGFTEVPVERLPVSRQQRYNSKRNSKIYFKELESPQVVKVG